MSLYAIINKIHLYTGLQATIALLVFFISVIPSYISESRKEPIVTHQKLTGTTDKKNLLLAKAVHNQVGLRFEAVPKKWMVSEGKPGSLLIKFKSPSARREVRLNKTNGDIEIKSWPYSFSQFIYRMHQETLGRRRHSDYSDSAWLWAWSWYIEFSILSLFILPVTGLYIWVSGRSRKKHWAKLCLVYSSITMVIIWNLIR